MKNILITSILIIVSQALYAQLNSGNFNVPASAQPVPNATATEKSAPSQPQIIAPAPNPVPPIYPGGEVKAAEVQRQIINPPLTPSGTQPLQKEPLSPIESTNNLQPNRPQREEKSRENPVIEIPNNRNRIRPSAGNVVKVTNSTSNTLGYKPIANTPLKTKVSTNKAKVETTTPTNKNKFVKRKP